MKSKEIIKTINKIQPQLHDLSNLDEHDKENQSNIITNRLNDDEIGCLEMDIEHLGKNIEELQLKFDQINNTSQIRASEDKNIQYNSSIEQISSNANLNQMKSKVNHLKKMKMTK